MKVLLKLFAGLRAAYEPAGRAGGGEFEFPEATTVAQALGRIKVPLEEAKIIFVNGRHAGPETALQDGDRLSVFPPVGGG